MTKEFPLTLYRVSPLGLLGPLLLSLALLLLASWLHDPVEAGLRGFFEWLKSMDLIAELINLGWGSWLVWLLYIPLLFALKHLLNEIAYALGTRLHLDGDSLYIHQSWPNSAQACMKLNRIESLSIQANGLPLNVCANLEIIGLGGTKLQVRKLQYARDLLGQLGYQVNE